MPLSPRRNRSAGAKESRARFRQRILRYGSRGESVRYVQNRLRQLDYAVFEADGVYGFLTEEAVRALQRDFRLHADGVVGPEVWELLDLPRLPSRKLPHTVRVGETMDEIARSYGISVTALREANRLLKKSRFHPGLRLAIPTRLIVGMLAAPPPPEPGDGGTQARVPLAPVSRLVLEPLVPDRLGNLVRDLSGPAPKLSRVARPYPRPWPALVDSAACGDGPPLWGDILLQPEAWLADAAFGSRRWRVNLRAAVSELACRKGLSGVNVTVGPIPKTALFQTAVAVNEILAALRRKKRDAMLTLAGPGTPNPGYARGESILGRFVEPPGKGGLVALLWPNRAEAERELPSILNRVRCWRLAVGPAVQAAAGAAIACAVDKASAAAARRLAAEFALLANRFNLAGVAVPVGPGVAPEFSDGCREHFHLRHESAATGVSFSVTG